jgi:diacylglycerol kinase (ATP)
MTVNRKIKVIINSLTGKRKAARIESALRSRLPGSCIDIRKTEYHGHALQMAQEAVRDNFDLIIAVGGDGTINEIINGIDGSDIGLGMIPCGSANDLAKYYRIPGNIDKAIEIIAAGNNHIADVIKVNTRYFLTTGGIGLGCHVLKAVEGMRRKYFRSKFIRRLIASWIYVLGLLDVFFSHRQLNHPVTLGLDNSSYSTQAVSVAVGNLPHLAGKFRILPSAQINDGKFDIYLIESCNNKMELLNVLINTLRGSQSRLANVKMFSARRLNLYSPEPIPFFVDGELMDESYAFCVEVIPRAIRLIVPENGGRC